MKDEELLIQLEHNIRILRMRKGIIQRQLSKLT